MSLETALAQYWQQAAALHGLVGARIYPITARQNGELPYLTWQRLSWLPTYHMTGRSNLMECTVQVDVWARDSVEAEKLAAALLTATDAKRQGALNGLDLRSMTVLNDIDVPEVPDDGGQIGVFHRAIDLDIWYRIT
jgi:hypothetical protein